MSVGVWLTDEGCIPGVVSQTNSPGLQFTVGQYTTGKYGLVVFVMIVGWIGEI